MRRALTSLAAVALVGGAALFAPAALADSWGIAIGTPGFAAGFGNRGGYIAGYGYVSPPVYYGPTYYYAPPRVYYYGPPVVYGYYRPWRHHYYYRHWR
jgi:hypothetical protein